MAKTKGGTESLAALTAADFETLVGKDIRVVVTDGPDVTLRLVKVTPRPLATRAGTSAPPPGLSAAKRKAMAEKAFADMRERLEDLGHEAACPKSMPADIAVLAEKPRQKTGPTKAEEAAAAKDMAANLKALGKTPSKTPRQPFTLRLEGEGHQQLTSGDYTLVLPDGTELDGVHLQDLPDHGTPEEAAASATAKAKRGQPDTLAFQIMFG